MRLRLFPFSLGPRPKAWLDSLDPESIITWDELTTAFLGKYFPPKMTADYRSRITDFQQQDGESLNVAWERHKDLLRECPHHGLGKLLVLQSFYDGLFTHLKQLLDTQIDGVWSTLVVTLYSKIIGHLQP